MEMPIFCVCDWRFIPISVIAKKPGEVHCQKTRDGDGTRDVDYEKCMPQGFGKIRMVNVRIRQHTKKKSVSVHHSLKKTHGNKAGKEFFPIFIRRLPWPCTCRIWRPKQLSVIFHIPLERNQKKHTGVSILTIRCFACAGCVDRTVVKIGDPLVIQACNKSPSMKGSMNIFGVGQFSGNIFLRSRKGFLQRMLIPKTCFFCCCPLS